MPGESKNWRGGRLLCLLACFHMCASLCAHSCACMCAWISLCTIVYMHCVSVYSKLWSFPSFWEWSLCFSRTFCLSGFEWFDVCTCMYTHIVYMHCVSVHSELWSHLSFLEWCPCLFFAFCSSGFEWSLFYYLHSASGFEEWSYFLDMFLYFWLCGMMSMLGPHSVSSLEWSPFFDAYSVFGFVE